MYVISLATATLALGCTGSSPLAEWILVFNFLLCDSIPTRPAGHPPRHISLNGVCSRSFPVIFPVSTSDSLRECLSVCARHGVKFSARTVRLDHYQTIFSLSLLSGPVAQRPIRISLSGGWDSFSRFFTCFFCSFGHFSALQNPLPGLHWRLLSSETRRNRRKSSGDFSAQKARSTHWTLVGLSCSVAEPCFCSLGPAETGCRISARKHLLFRSPPASQVDRLLEDIFSR